MMERLTGRNEKGELLVNGKVVYAGELYEVASVLEEYEDMEESLEKVYGKCDELLETAVNHLVMHKDLDIGEPAKSILLTDEDAEKWEKWKNAEEQCKMMMLPCMTGDTVYELCKCDDGIYRIYPMVVKSLSYYGQIRKDKNGNVCVWNIYAESDYTYMYKSFYDFGKTVFLTEQEAEKVLEGLKNE